MQFKDTMSLHLPVSNPVFLVPLRQRFKQQMYQKPHEGTKQDANNKHI
jgi:hypothetical protein